MSLSDPLWQYLANGDFVGFILALYYTRMGQLFYALLSMIPLGVAYLRTKSLTFTLLLVILLGGSFQALFGFVSPLVILFYGLGIGGLIYQVFMSRKSS